MMSEPSVIVQIDRIEELERDLERARRLAARSLLAIRSTSGLSLRDVARVVRLTAPAINKIERGMQWRTKTVRRIAQFYSKLAA
jgi:predicted transcriptional regulator